MRRFCVILAATTALTGAAFAQSAPNAAAPTIVPGVSDTFLAQRQAEQREAASEAKAQAEAPKPADAKARAAIAQTDLVTQARFWSDEYAKNTKDIEAGVALADLLRRIGSFERSIEIVQQVLPNAPQNPQLWTSLGLSLTSAQRGGDAIGPLQRAMVLSPKDSRLPSALGVAFDQIGQADMARAAYQQALLLAPEDPGILTNYGFSLILAGDTKQAEALLRRAVANPAAPAQARQNLAMAVGLQGRFEEAQLIAARDVPPDQAAQNVAWLRAMVDQPSRWNALRADNSQPDSSQ